jgi:hypothetical protein
MNFEFAHHIPFAREEVAQALLDRRFQDSLTNLGPLSERKVISQETTGEKVVRSTRCVLGMELPSAAKRFIGGADPAWTEEAIWDPAAMTWEWIIRPEVAAHLLRASGTIELLDTGDGTLRRVAGSIGVAVPLYGGRVEKWIAKGLEDAYAEEADRLVKWLTTGGVTHS